MTAGARGPVLDRPARLRVRWWARWLGLAALLAAAVAAGWLLHGSSRTIKVQAAPATVYQHTQAGAVAAAEVALTQADTACGPVPHCPPASAYSLGFDGGGQWSLGYRILSYTPSSATVDAWQVLVDSGTGGSGSPLASALSWGTTTMMIVWTGARWEQRGASTESPFGGPIPPPNDTTGNASYAFQSEISAWTRFPVSP
jgi:hypothetical protein